ncbi:Transcription factor RLM1 [Lachnellula cervina]|uniref:Transcription factor RLM1 n=1 Tax=Lachnellula cervina TaxID=1316786 RepID=A0A7D8UJP4_9HELO|nr:Transcription factor RLM1 [Lachnellula cervina]
MGRRKIEIKAIKDDRNRSVYVFPVQAQQIARIWASANLLLINSTFLKRKGGLFKKAHELSVLCSVDVAVIIFGNNKKLYEYSSSDIGEILTRYNYYGGANEHKGPADFNGKGGKDMDDDDDDDGSMPSHHGSVEPQMMPPQFQQPVFQPPQHMRQGTPSSSPPIPNGAFPHHPQQRQHTPQPHPGSRPSSRNGPRRQSSLVPQQHVQPQPPNGYAYMPNPAIYNPNNGPPPHSHHGIPQHMQGPPMHGPQGVPQQGPPPQYPNYGPPPQQQQHAHPQQVQQIYAEEQRRASMPPNFPPQERPPSRPEPSPPLPRPQQVPQQQSPPQQHQPPPPQQQEPEKQQQAPVQQMLEPVKRVSVKSRSIFTPIDESRSILSQHWASSTSNTEPTLGETPTSNNRSQSVDVGAVSRLKSNNSPPPKQPVRANTHKNRISHSSNTDFAPPSRTNSASLGGGKRPVLKVQIPEGDSDGGSATADSNSSPRSSTNAAGNNPQRNGLGGESHSSGVVLPPPSPSASALLSAGASGPPNPFARPHHPSQASQANSNTNNMIDTPVSALPSRFMTNEFLPSPSSFYPEWSFRGSDNNTLPSPLNFATPVVGTGPSFLREDSGERAGQGKRKTPDMDGSSDQGGEAKRPKHEA